MNASTFFLVNRELTSAPGIKLLQGGTLLGRDPTCHIVVADPSVSRFHAEFSLQGTNITLRDLGSRNGTFVDGKRVDSSQVRVGQLLHFGCVLLQLETADENVGKGNAELETASISDVLEAAPTELDNLPLSAAVRRVFDLLLAGLAEKEIASRLGVSRHTVHTHVRKIYDVLGVRSRAELAALFLRTPNGTRLKPERMKRKNC